MLKTQRTNDPFSHALSGGRISSKCYVRDAALVPDRRFVGSTLFWLYQQSSHPFSFHTPHTRLAQLSFPQKTRLTPPGPPADTIPYKMSLPPRRRVVAAPARRPPAELRAVRVILEPDPNPNTSYLRQKEFESRLASYEKDEFDFVTMRVEASVLIDETEQTLVSPGVPGIESDTAEEDLDELISGEWTVLRGVLKTVGVSTDQLPLEVEREWIEWRT